MEGLRGWPSPPPCPPPLPQRGRGGGIIPLTFPPTPPPHAAGEEGGMSGAGAISRTRSPLSHAVGEEGGSSPSPSPNPLLPTLWERKGGDERSRGDLTNQITPLPQCGRGAGGEGYPRTPPAPPRSLSEISCCRSRSVEVQRRCACTSGYTRGDMVSSCPIRQLLRHQMIVHCVPSIDEFHLWAVRQ